MPWLIERSAVLTGCMMLLATGLVAGRGIAAPAAAKTDAADVMKSDEVGYAGFGAGEGVTAAHGTLPVPSYVEVTDLSSGRTILVLINGRGTLANDRLIDLSCDAADQLGLSGTQAVPVRVRRVNPPDPEAGALRAGQPAAERLAAPAPLLTALRKKLPPAPKGTGERCGTPPAPSSTALPAVVRDDDPPRLSKTPAPTATLERARAVPEPARAFIVEEARPVPRPAHRAPPVAGRFAVQLAALSDKGKANALARKAGGHVETAGRLFRVRIGPFATESQARVALASIRLKGFAEARVVTNGGH